jgi:hypothetical protein
MDFPKWRQRGRHTQRDLAVSWIVVQRPPQCGAHVAALAPDSVEPLGLARPDHGGGGLFRLTQEISGVPIRDRVNLIVGSLSQALQCVLTHRFKKPIARLGSVIFALHERSIDQPSERVEDVFNR